MAARTSDFFYTKNMESDFFFIKNPNLTKKKSGGWEGRGGGGCVAKVSDFFFFQKNPSLKKKCFLFEGVKVRED